MSKLVPIQLNLDFADDKSISNELDIYGEIGQKALQRALRKFVRRLGYQLKQLIAQSNAITQKSLKTRVRVSFSFTAVDLGKGRVWLGLNPMSYKHIGTPQQLRKGVRSGKHFAQGAFIWNGHVFKRRGRRRFPIDKITLDIEDKARPIIARLNASIQGGKMKKGFLEIFHKELNYALNHEKH